MCYQQHKGRGKESYRKVLCKLQEGCGGTALNGKSFKTGAGAGKEAAHKRGGAGPAHQSCRGRALTAAIPVSARAPRRPAAAAPPPDVRRAAAPAPAARPGAPAPPRCPLGGSRRSGSPPPAACGTAPLPHVPAPTGAAPGSAAPRPPVQVLPELLGQRLLQPLPLRRRRAGALWRCAAAAARHVPAATPLRTRHGGRRCGGAGSRCLAGGQPQSRRAPGLRSRRGQ